LNAPVFDKVVKAAGLAPFQKYRLIEAAREAFLHSDIELCCEAVELTELQREALCLQPHREQIA
jgi:hypothetical protein